MKATLKHVIVFAFMVGTCDFGRSDDLDAYSLNYEFSQSLAKKLPANCIQEMISSGVYEPDDGRTVEVEISDGQQRVQITLGKPLPDGVLIEPVHLRFSETQSWMNNELLSLDGVTDRLRTYLEVAATIEAKPVVMISFDEGCNVSFLIEKALFLKENGISHWTFYEEDSQIIETRSP